MNAEQAATELRDLEPIFHRPEIHGSTSADFDRLMAPTFFEVGASGSLYSRAFVLKTLLARHADPAYTKPKLIATDFGVHPIATDTWLATYKLEQPGNRLSRRATVWQSTPAGWQALYHQGTLIQP